MGLAVYTLEQDEQWDAVVRSFQKYDVYWLSGYVKAFNIHGDGYPLLFYYDNRNTRGINVVMKRDISEEERFASVIPSGVYYDFTTPYGYGGWIIEGNDIEGLFSAYSSWIKKHNIVSEFVRFHPLIKNHEKCQGHYDIIQLGEVVHMDLSSPEVLWANIISKNRNMIRKAIKNDVKIYNGRYPEIFKNFRAIYNETMNRDNAESYYYFEKDFYESVLEDLPQNAQVFYAVQNGVIIAASIILVANGMMNYHLSGSLLEYRSIAPTNLLLYKAALWGYANGCKTLYLGGGVGSGTDSLFKFKRAFYKGELNHFFIGRKIYDQECYEELVKINGVSDSNYFPKYRA